MPVRVLLLLSADSDTFGVWNSGEIVHVSLLLHQEGGLLVLRALVGLEICVSVVFVVILVIFTAYLWCIQLF